METNRTNDQESKEIKNIFEKLSTEEKLSIIELMKTMIEKR